MKQVSSVIFMVRPASFGFNPETAESNSFQNKLSLSQDKVIAKVLEEFDLMVDKLRSAGVRVKVFQDTENPVKPDAVFPNNWISLHADGKLILYPMLAENRRLERSPAIIQQLVSEFGYTEHIDYSLKEKEGKFLEGTGSVIFDHVNKLAFACLSPRTNQELLEELCELLGYESVSFTATNAQGAAIYHTNVMMSVGIGYAVVCLAAITSDEERNQLLKVLTTANLELIEISLDQMNALCGNVLEIGVAQGRNVLAMSQTSFEAFSAKQKGRLSSYCDLLPLSVPTIEKIGGGSVRCMIAQVFPPEK